MARKSEVEALRAALKMREGELEVISAIQRGVAGGLDFQGIVDLVGDKLREVFRTGDVGILWWDQDTDMIHALYRYEHGVPLKRRAPRKLERDQPRDRPIFQIINSRQAAVVNTRAEQTARGMSPAPGTDWAHSIVGVPIIGSDRVLGLLSMQNHEREYAYGEAEVRLLQTIASSLPRRIPWSYESS